MSDPFTSADTADPAFNTTTHDGRLISAVYEQLAQFDESLKAVPSLAQSWEVNETATLWTFKLREGVTFHDGDRFTAADVVHTYQRLLDPDAGSPGAGSLDSLLDPDGVSAIDDRTVHFSLKQAHVDFPLATVFRQAYIIPEGAGGELATAPVGTGPFKVPEFVAGEQTTFVKNENYWQEGLPRVDAIELLSITEAAARVAALQRGQVDVIEAPPFTELSAFESNPDTKLATQPKGNMPLIAMQTDVPPFDDNRVRLAMKYAMDRQGMLDLVAQGFGTLVNDVPIASLLQYALPGPPRPRDVDMAKQLLSEAGFPNGIDVSLKVSDVQAGFIDFATVYQQQAAEAGINVELDVRPADTYWDTVWLQEPMFVSAYISRPTDGMLGLLYPSGADWNETHWFREDWDALLAEARSTLDPAERIAVYQRAQQILVDEGGHLVPYMVSTIDAVRANVTWQPSGTPFHNFAALDIDV
ncbi:MAG: ABC transporter substrate-binding protein [Nitriliruptorales bacterium]